MLDYHTVRSSLEPCLVWGFSDAKFDRAPTTALASGGVG